MKKQAKSPQGGDAPPHKQIRLIPSSEARKVVATAWHQLVSAHSQEKPTREILVFRNALVALSTEEPLELLLSVQIAQDVQAESSTFKLSHLLFSALDFELGRKALKREVQTVTNPLELSLTVLVDYLFRTGQVISPRYLEYMRDLDRTLECISKLDIAYGFRGNEAIASMVRDILCQYASPDHTVKFVRTAALALAHISPELVSVQTKCKAAQAAWLFAQVSLSRIPQQEASWLDCIAPLLSNSLENMQAVDCVMLALEALCAWSTHFAPMANASALQQCFHMCLPFTEHLTLASLSLNTYERLLAVCVKQDNAELLVAEMNRLTTELINAKQCGRGFYLVLEKFIKHVGASRVVEWNRQICQHLLGKKSHQEVVGNGICNALCALFKSWLVETKFKPTKEMKLQFHYLALELQSGPADVFTNFHVARRFLNDFFSEFQCVEESKANRELGVYLLQQLTRPREDEWARYSVLLALERGGVHVTVGDGESSLQISRSELERGLLSSQVETRQLVWALVSTRVKKSAFPSKIVLDSVLAALKMMIKFDCNPLKTNIERLVDHILTLLLHNKKDEDEDEDARTYCREFISAYSELLASQLYCEAPLHALLLPLELTSHLLFGCNKNKPKLEPLIAPLISTGTVRVLLDLLLHSSFDSLRIQVYNVLEQIPFTAEQVQADEFLQREVYSKSAPKSRRECDATALLFRLFNKKLPGAVALHMATEQTDDDVYMRQALSLAKQCVTVTTAYNVGCVIVDTSSGSVMATGYSRELEGNTHAEEVALARLPATLQQDAKLTLYTTMEPCSLRLSGKEGCAARILACKHKITRVVVGVNEPDTFVKNCEGNDMLQSKGIEIARISPWLSQECLAASTGNVLSSSEAFVHELVQNLKQSNAQVLALVTLRYILRDSSKLPPFDLLSPLLACVENGVKQMVESTMQGDDCDEDEDEDSAWLIVREGSEALIELLERSMSTCEEDKIIQVANWFLFTALQLKHTGAMTYVTKGLERIVKLLLRSSTLQDLVVKQWLPQLYIQVRNEREFDKAIRRNEGFCFCFRAIVRAAELCKRGDVIQQVCNQLVHVEPYKQAAHLNVLKALFEDTVSARSLTVYIAPCIQIAVNGFSSEEWKIRSASLSLIVSLLRRIVGDQPSKTCVSVNSFQAVFQCYPSLVAVLTAELQLAVDSPSSNQLALFPLLLFLASMKLSGKQTEEESHFASLAKQICQQHPVFQVRTVAARAWAVLEPRPQEFLALEEDEKKQNALHGYLLYLRQTGCDRFAKECNAMLVNENNSFIVRELALELCNASFAWLDEYVNQRICQDDLVGGDGPLVGKSRFYSQVMVKYVQSAVQEREFARLVQVLSHLLEQRTSKSLVAFEELCQACKGVERELHGLVPMLFQHCHESEHVEALAALLLEPTNECSTDNLLRLLSNKPRNVRLQAAGLQVLSFTSQSDFHARIQAASTSAALEFRLASAWCVGNTLNQLSSWICALHLLCDEDEQVREVTRARLAMPLNYCTSAIFVTAWPAITTRFSTEAAWREQLEQWVFNPPSNHQASDEDSQPLEYTETKLWVDLASQQLERIVREQFIAGKITEQERRGMSVRAFEALKAAQNGGSFMQKYAALCAVRALGDGLSSELMQLVHQNKMCVDGGSFALQQVVNEIQTRFLWK